MKRMLNIAGFVAVLSLPVFAFSADNKALFDKLDTNKDGMISREEFTSCPLVRNKDKKGKNKIQHQELCANPGLALSIEDKQRLFDKVDRDKSGTVSLKELNRYATPEGFAPIRF